MKPFNLDAALRGEPVVTRDGEPVTDLHLFSIPESQRPLAGVCGGGLGRWSSSGESGAYENLFMAQRTETRWVNIGMNDSRGCSFAFTYEYEGDAKSAAQGDPEKYLAIAVPIEVTLP